MELCWEILIRYVRQKNLQIRLTFLPWKWTFLISSISFCFFVCLFVFIGPISVITFVFCEGGCHDNRWNRIHPLFHWPAAVFADLKPSSILGILCHDADCTNEFDGLYKSTFILQLLLVFCVVLDWMSCLSVNLDRNHHDWLVNTIRPKTQVSPNHHNSFDDFPTLLREHDRSLPN